MKQNRILALLLALLLALSTIGVAEEIVDTEWTVVEDGEAVEEALPVEEEVEAKSKKEDFEIVDGVIKAYNSADTKVVIDAKWGVTEIGDGAFRGKSIVSITIPATVTKISNEAFQDCALLKTVKLNKGLTSIGIEAFSGCSALASITLPATLTEIGESCFANSGVKSVKIPADLEVIPDFAFNNCVNLTSVTLGKNTQIIGDVAFAGCVKLSSVKFNDNLYSVGASAFSGCASLKAAKFGPMCNAIGAGAFSGCTKLASVTLPFNCWTIKSQTFVGCSALKTIDISQVETIENNAFSGCVALKTVKAGSYLRTINENAFAACPDAMAWNVYVDTDAEAYAKEKGYTVTYRKDYTFAAEVKSIECNIEDWVRKAFYSVPQLPSTADITYKISNAKVLEERDGEFYGKAEGTSNITATCTIPDPTNPKKNLFKKSATLKVKVNNPDKLYSVSIITPNGETKFPMNVGESAVLEAALISPTAEADITWKSSSATIATIDEKTGLLIPKSEGTATITVTAQQDKIKKTASVKVTVTDPNKLTALKFEEATKSMATGDKGTVAAVTEPAAAIENTTITYKSSNAKVVKVDANTGAVEALAKGTATITATGVQGKVKKTATVKITVKDWGTISGLKIIDPRYYGGEFEGAYEMSTSGDALGFLLVALPESPTTELTYKWSIADTEVLEFLNPENDFESGVDLVAVGAGMTKVTVEVIDSANGNKGTISCDVLVDFPGLEVIMDGASLDNDTIEMKVGETRTVTWKADYDLPGEGYEPMWGFPAYESAVVYPVDDSAIFSNTITFEALKEGTETVTLYLEKPYPKTGCSRREQVTFNVHVSEGTQSIDEFDNLKIEVTYGGTIEDDEIKAEAGNYLRLKVTSTDEDFDPEKAEFTWDFDDSILQSGEIHAQELDAYVAAEGRTLVNCDVVCGNKVGSVEIYVNSESTAPAQPEEISGLRIIYGGGVDDYEIGGQTVRLNPYDHLMLTWKCDDPNITPETEGLTTQWTISYPTYLAASDLEHAAIDATALAPGYTQVQVVVYRDGLRGSDTIDVEVNDYPEP